MIKAFFEWFSKSLTQNSLIKGNVVPTPVTHYTYVDGMHHLIGARGRYGVEWKWTFFKRNSLRLEVVVDDGSGDYELGLYIAIPYLISYTLKLSYPQFFIVKWLLGEGSGARHYGFYSCSTHTSLMLHHDDAGYRKNSGFQYLISYERLLGCDYTGGKKETVGSETFTGVTIDNANYPTQEVILDIAKIKYTVRRNYWTYESFYRWDVELVQGGPLMYNGKGENSWDQEPNELTNLSVGSDCTSYYQATCLFLEHLEKCRRKYG